MAVYFSNLTKIESAHEIYGACCRAVVDLPRSNKNSSEIDAAKKKKKKKKKWSGKKAIWSGGGGVKGWFAHSSRSRVTKNTITIISCIFALKRVIVNSRTRYSGSAIHKHNEIRIETTRSDHPWFYKPTNYVWFTTLRLVRSDSAGVVPREDPPQFRPPRCGLTSRPYKINITSFSPAGVHTVRNKKAINQIDAAPPPIEDAPRQLRLKTPLCIATHWSMLISDVHIQTVSLPENRDNLESQSVRIHLGWPAMGCYLASGQLRLVCGRFERSSLYITLHIYNSSISHHLGSPSSFVFLKPVLLKR